MPFPQNSTQIINFRSPNANPNFYVEFYQVRPDNYSLPATTEVHISHTIKTGFPKFWLMFEKFDER
jgi:hypothetical protein